MKVLVAEDDDHIRNGLMEILENEGYKAIPARDGQSALALFGSQSPDFMCLDIMMPKISGYDVCREVRKRGSTIPIIFITAKTEEVDRVLGLELGADDYILKPFGVREVLARIRAVTRRCLQARAGKASDGDEGGELTAKPFAMGDLEILPSELRAHRGKEAIELSLRDLKILDLLKQNPGKVLDRYTIFSRVWGWDHIPNSRTLDQHISQLRKRIERDPKRPDIIQTVHGVGYRYDE